MLDALYYALRFLVLATVLAALAWLFVGPITRSEPLTGLVIVVVNTYVLFATIDRFVEAKLAGNDVDPS